MILIPFRNPIMLQMHHQASNIVTNKIKCFSPSVRKCCTHSSSNANSDFEKAPVLKARHIIIQNSGEEISSLLSKYEQTLHNALDYPVDNKINVISHRKHILHNLRKYELENASISNLDFEHVQHWNNNIRHLPIGQYPFIYESLTKLCVSRDNPIMQGLYEEISYNLHTFDIKQLTIISQCAFVNDDISLCAKIVQHINNLLERHCIHSSSFSELYILFRSLGHLMSPTMLNLCVSLAIDEVVQKRVLDFSSIRLFCVLVEGSCEEAMDIVRTRIEQSGISSLNTVFNIKEIDLESAIVIGSHLDSLFGNTHIVAKIRNTCSSYMSSNSTTLASAEILKMAFFIPPNNLFIHEPYENVKLAKVWSEEAFSIGLLKCMENSDNHIIFQFLRLCHQTGLPANVLTGLHDRVVNIFDSSSEDELQMLFKEDEKILMLLQRFVQTLERNNLNVSKILINLISRECSPDECVRPIPKSRAPLVLHSLTTHLFNGRQLLPKELDLYLSLLNQLKMSSLMFLYVKLESAIKKNSHDQAKAQKMHIIGQTRRCLQEKISSLHNLPASLLYNEVDSLWSVPQSLFKQSRILHTIVSHLKRLTRVPDELNCLRAIQFLSATTTNIPIYQPALFENLLQFIYSSRPMPVHDFLMLLQILSSAAYRPNDYDKFVSICLNYQRDVHEKKMLLHAQQVQLSHCLSLYKIYDEEALHTINSLDFMSVFDKELEDMVDLHGQDADFYRNCLALLNRNVAVERPDVNVLPITRFARPSDDSDRRTPHDLINSIQRIFQDSTHIQVGTQSSHGHRIDALVCLNNNCDVIDPNAFDVESCYKLAFLYLSPLDLCFKAKGRRTGRINTVIRHLKTLGYFVVEVQFNRLYGMEMHSDEAVDNFLREQIIHAIGPRFFFNKKT